jgi:hypothetical protein
VCELREVHLYDESTAPKLELAAVAGYLAEMTGCRQVRTRRAFLMEHSSPEQWPDLAARIARLKVRDLDAPFRAAEPAYAESEFERRRLANEDRGPFGVLYDAFQFQRLLRQSMPAGEVRLDLVHVAFTNRTLGTWEEDDRRYHLRTIVLGIPAIISTTGLVEAPAKPREFYLAQQQLGVAARSEHALALLKERFHGQFLDHDDPRLTEVAKGYVMQAIAYQLTGEAFCPDPDCRLFNAHWQEEMMRAQLAAERKSEYCRQHERILAALRGERRKERGGRQQPWGRVPRCPGRDRGA